MDRRTKVLAAGGAALALAAGGVAVADASSIGTQTTPARKTGGRGFLRPRKLTHADLGQMQLYVHHYDETQLTPGDNPTLGLLLCADKNDLMVKYTLGKENKQIFASPYKLLLPSP